MREGRGGRKEHEAPTHLKIQTLPMLDVSLKMKVDEVCYVLVSTVSCTGGTLVSSLNIADSLLRLKQSEYIRTDTQQTL